jgi:hypothetical protein
LQKITQSSNGAAVPVQKDKESVSEVKVTATAASENTWSIRFSVLSFGSELFQLARKTKVSSKPTPDQSKKKKKKKERKSKKEKKTPSFTQDYDYSESWTMEMKRDNFLIII